MILKESIAGGASLPASGSEDGASAKSYVGLTGEAATDLHPAGKGIFDGEFLDIISDGEYVEKGTPLKIVKHEGSRIVVIRNI
jgi:membrane-bound serine protease (ClpP class)